MGIFLLVVYCLSAILSLIIFYKDSKLPPLCYTYWGALAAVVVSFIPILNTIITFTIGDKYLKVVFKPVIIFCEHVNSFMSKGVFWAK